MTNINHGCLGIPGCNHPLGEECGCVCHKPMTNIKETTEKVLTDHAEVFRNLAEYDKGFTVIEPPQAVEYVLKEYKTQPQDSWRSILDIEFPFYPRDPIYGSENVIQRDRLKNFISKRLQEQREEAILQERLRLKEKIEGMKKEIHYHDIIEEPMPAMQNLTNQGYNQALTEILDLLETK